MKSSNRSGFTLLELMVGLSLLLLLGTLASGAFRHLARFYTETSERSRILGIATLVLDRVEQRSFGLPIQALKVQDGGGTLVVQPLELSAAGGEVIYADHRVVYQTDHGIHEWFMGGQPRTLGSPMTGFPGDSSHKKTLAVEGWILKAEFPHNRFPLTVTLKSPGPRSRTYLRTLAGLL